MTLPTTPFKLHAARLSTDAPVTPAGDLPAEVAGQPATYFWKDMIHAGSYVHPTRKFSLAVDGDRLQRWADIGRQMLAAGVAIPINCDHSDRARDVVGYVKEFKLIDDRLLGLCQFIGDDAALTAARNWVSVGIDPDFTDGQARQWGEAIAHLALTPVPVVPDQDEFVLVADSPLALPCTSEQFQTILNFIGEEIDADDCIARVIECLTASKQDSPPQDDSSDLQTELAAAREQVLQLSARLPPVMSRESEAAIVESAMTKFDAAVSRGSLSPAARDKLVATLVKGGDGRANVMALSRTANPGGDRSLAMAVAEILLDNNPIELGERTGLQAMLRQIPGEDSSPIEQLRQYMTKIASVSG